MSKSGRTGFTGVLSDIFQRLASLWRAARTTAPYFFGRTDFVKEVTEQYPDPVSSRTVDDLPPRTRGLLKNDILKCTGCGDCQTVCPVRAISVETEEGAFPEDRWVETFDIDFSRCIFCGHCVTACRPASLSHTAAFEGSESDLTKLVAHFGRGRISFDQRKKWEDARASKKREESGRLF